MASKGQGLTLETIVIAALVVIVLVVLILIFTGNIGIFSSTVSDCQSQRGECRAVCLEKEAGLSSTSCSKEGKLCCVKLS